MKYGTMSYLESEGKILMIKKGVYEDDQNSGFYSLPGGKINENEMGLNLEGRSKSVIRKTEEQAGIKIINPVFRGTIYFDNKERVCGTKEILDDFLFYLFAAKDYIKEEDASWKRSFWIGKETLPRLLVLPGDKKMYEWLNDGRNFAGTICYVGNKLDSKKTFVDWF